jgi:hypothetical protein
LLLILQGLSKQIISKFKAAFLKTMWRWLEAMPPTYYDISGPKHTWPKVVGKIQMALEQTKGNKREVDFTIVMSSFDKREHVLDALAQITEQLERHPANSQSYRMRDTDPYHFEVILIDAHPDSGGEYWTQYQWFLFFCTSRLMRWPFFVFFFFCSCRTVPSNSSVPKKVHGQSCVLLPAKMQGCGEGAEYRYSADRGPVCIFP